MFSQKIIVPYELSILTCRSGCHFISKNDGSGAKLIATWQQESGASGTAKKNRKLESRLEVVFKEDSSFETSHLIVDGASHKQLGYRSIIQGVYMVSQDQLTFFYTRAFLHDDESGSPFSPREALIEDSSFVNSWTLTLSYEHGKMTWSYPSSPLNTKSSRDLLNDGRIPKSFRKSED